MQLVENFSIYVTKHLCLEMLSPVCFSLDYSHSKDYSFSSWFFWDFFFCFSPFISDFSVGTHVGYGTVNRKRGLNRVSFPLLFSSVPGNSGFAAIQSNPCAVADLCHRGESSAHHIPAAPGARGFCHWAVLPTDHFNPIAFLIIVSQSQAPMLCFCLCKRENIKDLGTFFHLWNLQRNSGLGTGFSPFLCLFCCRSDLWHVATACIICTGLANKYWPLLFHFQLVFLHYFGGFLLYSWEDKLLKSSAFSFLFFNHVGKNTKIKCSDAIP